MSSNESPYLKYGLGFEEDVRVIGSESFHRDVLDLAEYLLKKFPKERVSIMHNMFQIGFNCGQRSMVDNAVPDELLRDAENFVDNMRSSVIEMEQIAHSLDFALERVEILKTENREHIKIGSLLEILIRSLLNCQEITEDSIIHFEQFLENTKQKNKPNSSANEVSEEK